MPFRPRAWWLGHLHGTTPLYQQLLCRERR
jgi:hypothetical protein